MRTISFGGTYSVNYDPASWPWRNAARDEQARDDVSWTKGQHNLGYGNIILGENTSNTHYESLQVNFRIENQHG